MGNVIDSSYLSNVLGDWYIITTEQYIDSHTASSVCMVSVGQQ